MRLGHKLMRFQSARERVKFKFVTRTRNEGNVCLCIHAYIVGAKEHALSTRKHSKPTRVMAKRVSVHIGRINAGMENNSKSTKEIKKNEAF